MIQVIHDVMHDAFGLFTAGGKNMEWVCCEPIGWLEPVHVYVPVFLNKLS